MPVYCDFLPETAKKWRISERSVRNYCALGKVDGAFLTGKTWAIPEDAKKPDRANKKNRIADHSFGSACGRKESETFGRDIP